ncbi:MAG: tyrosine-type recombinase/integrase, partial [Ktedonobacteraceae bacterium]
SRPATGWVFPAKRATVGHIVDNTIYEPHLNAVEEIKLNPREFVIYALRHTCLTRWGNSGMDAWTLARLAGHSNIRQSMTYVHPSDNALHVQSIRCRRAVTHSGTMQNYLFQTAIRNCL